MFSPKKHCAYVFARSSGPFQFRHQTILPYWLQQGLTELNRGGFELIVFILTIVFWLVLGNSNPKFANKYRDKYTGVFQLNLMRRDGTGLTPMPQLERRTIRFREKVCIAHPCLAIKLFCNKDVDLSLSDSLFQYPFRSTLLPP